MFNNAGRLKVNMGNIYFKLGQYAKAIKFYRMALDQVHTMLSKSSLWEKSIINQG
jgi:intraflagellar transport protein 88